jgi:hypothetical protein
VSPEWASAVASLGPIDLTRRCRRRLGIGLRDHTSLVVTDDALLVVTRRAGTTKLVARFPRDTAVVTHFGTLPLGGDFLVDRVVIEVGDMAIRGDFDGRLHGDAERVVAALGGVAPGR